MAEVKVYLYAISEKTVKHIPKEEYLSKKFFPEYDTKQKEDIWKKLRDQLSKSKGQDVKKYKDIKYIPIGEIKGKLLVLSMGVEKTDTLKEIYNLENTSKGNYNLIQVKDKATINKLRNGSALTIEGTPLNDSGIKQILNFFNIALKKNIKQLDIYVIKGKMMNEYSKLTGKNAYSNDLNIVCIELSNFNMDKLMGLRVQYMGLFRWLDDVCDNNERRQGTSKINREQEVIQAFENVRQSGVTNMYARDLVCQLAKITKEEYMNCVENYDKLIKKYSISRG